MRGSALFFLGLPLGVFITFAALAVMCGGVEPALGILGMSIICSAGVSLVIWIPLSWFVGWITLQITWFIVWAVSKITINILERSTAPNDSTQIRSDALPAAQKISLVNYIDKGIKQGWSDSQITSRLRAQGWKDEEIAEAQLVVRAKLEGN
jgi:ABC-type transport system involved in multi-copper enzyme maturation permease subunit